ncbi:hypothetical protein Fcan01_27719 [Folsomia candida]|uniref:Uncharacterized protein n=1 Tax=Folsomia candida TaxID=158441 RepID=A0A226CZP2_FOLCA|nr:hypothetical protein Fcan01_27719 [Folsomia candida]
MGVITLLGFSTLLLTHHAQTSHDPQIGAASYLEKHNFHPPPELDVVKLLNGVSTSCDVNIAYSNSLEKETADFYFNPVAECHWPTTITALNHQGMLNSSIQMALDILRCRISPSCRIPVVVPSEVPIIKSFYEIHHIATFAKYKLLHFLNDWSFHLEPTSFPPITIFFTMPNILLRMTDYILCGIGRDGKPVQPAPRYYIGPKDIVIAIYPTVDGPISICVHVIRGNSANVFLPRPKLLCKSGKDTDFIEMVAKFKLPHVAWSAYVSPWDNAKQEEMLTPNSLREFNFLTLSPFSLERRDVQYHLFHQLLLHGGVVNATVRTWAAPEFLNSVVWTSAGDFTLLSSRRHYVIETITPSRSGVQFLTCYEERFISFQFYLIPFQPALWVGILLSITIVVSALFLYNKYHSPIDKRISYAPWVLVLGTIFDEPNSIPGCVEGKSFHRLVFGCWTLMAIFLTNCYTGLVITELNAPHPSVQPETISDLACGDHFRPTGNITKWAEAENILKYWSPLHRAISLGYYNKTVSQMLENPFESEACYRLLSPPLDSVPFYFNTSSGRVFPSTYIFLKIYAVFKDMFIQKDLKDVDHKAYPEMLLLRPGHMHQNAFRLSIPSRI